MDGFFRAAFNTADDGSVVASDESAFVRPE
jgi:hypothetical protein